MKYREVIYGDYFSNQVNKKKVDYQQLIAIQQKQLMRDIVPHLPSNTSSKIMDVGCGFGSMVYTAKNAGYTNIAGIDLSSEQVAVAHSLGLNEVKESSIEQWVATNEKVDCLLAIDLIEHLSKDELVHFLAHVRRSLTTNGKVILRTPNMDAPLASVYAHGDFSHETFLNKNSALQLMQSTGFERIHVSGGIIHNQSSTNPLRALAWQLYKLKLKLGLWVTGRQWNEVVFEPNLIIVAEVN